MAIKKIRFFGSNGCADCIKTYILISRYQIECEYVDVDSEDKNIQDICDANEVYDLPHIQFLDANNRIIIEHVGPIEEVIFVAYLTEDFTIRE